MAAGSRMQGYDVGGRLAESCMEGCYDSERALGAQRVGKASGHLLSRHFAFCPDDIGCSWHVAFTAWRLGCGTACSGDAFKTVLSRLTKCSEIFVVGVGVEFTQHISC